MGNDIRPAMLKVRSAIRALTTAVLCFVMLVTIDPSFAQRGRPYRPPPQIHQYHPPPPPPELSVEAPTNARDVARPDLHIDSERHSQFLTWDITNQTTKPAPDAHRPVIRDGAFAGTEESRKRAERFVGRLPDQQTTKMEEAKIYVEYISGFIYYYSNFALRPSPSNLPMMYGETAKLIGDPRQNPDIANIAIAFRNLVYESPPTEDQKKQANNALFNNVKIYFDVSMFDENGIPRLDLSNLKHVTVVEGEAGRKLEATVEPLITYKPPPSIISRIKGCCLFGRPPHWTDKFSRILSQQRFDPKKIKVALLYIEGKAEEQFDNSPLAKAARVSGDAAAVNSKDALAKIMKAARDSTLILLGHVEGSNYVIRQSNDVAQFSMPINQVRAMAKQYNVQLIDIGCRTTSAINRESFGLGVMTEYSPGKAVESLDSALRDSTTFEDFLVNISSEGLKVVIEPSFFEKDVKSVSLYSKVKERGGKIWAKVAEITFSYFR